MADRDRDPRTNVNVVKTDRAGGNSALWLILGGVVVALAIFFFVVSGDDVADGVAGDGADATVIVDEGVNDAVDGANDPVEGTADTVDGAAPTVETPAPRN